MTSLINPDHIQIKGDVKDRFAAISLAANPLIKEAFVKEGFLEAVIKREKTFPTGLPTAIGVALPHTEAQHVENEGISILTLKKPVIFLGMGNPEEEVWVEIIFLLAIKNPEKQLNVLQTIIKMIQSESALKKINSAKNVKTIYNLINEWI